MKDKMEMLGKLMSAKKDGDELDPMYKKAKMGVLKDLHKHMGSMIGDDMSMPMDMKKVTVAADDEEGLEQGLEKAKDLVEEMPMAEESEEMSEEEILAKMDELKALLAKKSMKA